MKEVKITCDCGKEADISNLSDNFDYIGCDEENNPMFKCKDCGVIVSG
jgi:hypothetical protein